MLAGLSPRQAFVKLQAEPPIRLDDTTRYLLASHRRVEKVTARGLTVRIGKVAYTYKSEATGRLIGQRVLAWFDVEDPSLITLTTLDQKDPVTVARETVLPAWRASQKPSRRPNGKTPRTWHHSAASTARCERVPRGTRAEARPPRSGRSSTPANWARRWTGRRRR